ncbi:MAG: NUDIX hydrolase [Planctomycetota bacterium]|nr:NUDIX hydrolase [Planctomycetota bacterium]
MSGDLPEFIAEERRLSMYGKDVLLESFRFQSRKTGELITDKFLLFGSDARPVVIFPLTERNEVVVLNHYRYATRCEVLELPGGTEKCLSELDVAHTELKEETGYVSESVEPVGEEARRIWFDPASCKVPFVPMLARNCEKTDEPKLADNEFFSVVLIPVTEWLAMIMDGRVCDSKSIATTFLALPHLGLEYKKGVWERPIL